MKHRKSKKTKKKNPVFLYVALGLVALLIGIAIFLFFQKTPDSIYVFPENPKQGDTVFIRVKSESSGISGNFEKEKLIFYRNGKLPEWIAFFGIDADQKPGGYKISVNAGMQQFTKLIKVGLADFSSASAVFAPTAAQTGITTEKAVNNIIKNDNPALKKVLANFTAAPYFSAPFSFPLSVMKNSGLSFGRFIGFGKSKIQHLGVDLAAQEDTNIYAVNDGKVVATLDLSNYGKTVIIDHGLDIFSLYLHLDEFKVSKGDAVKRGQLIGLSGETGYATAPHLHFSIRVGGSRVDPVVFIKTTQKMNDNFILADLLEAFLNIFK